jgi:hypothetical protein
MCALRKIRSLMGVMLLCPAGMVAANDIELLEPGTPVPAQAMPAMAPVAPMWPQMMPVPGVQPYYLAPPPGMAWPMPPQYPAPPVRPPAMFAPWMPFVWVWMPVPATAPMPAEVDYGPVADTPLIELPLDEMAASPTALAGTVVSPVAIETDIPVAAGEAVANNSLVESKPATAAEGALPAGIVPGPAAAGRAPVRTTVVDYGPVMPTPVVDMLTLQKRFTKASLRNRAQGSSRAVSKSTVAPPDKPNPGKAGKPAKKRMCWNKGVVAPCR